MTEPLLLNLRKPVNSWKSQVYFLFYFTQTNRLLGCDEALARQFLQQNGWNVQRSLDLFYLQEGRLAAKKGLFILVIRNYCIVLKGPQITPAPNVFTNLATAAHKVTQIEVSISNFYLLNLNI
jgi:hypothetical protein